MPLLKKNFIQGVMDKDSDNRLIEDGKIRDGLNIRINRSEGAGMGKIEKPLGNKALSTLGLTNAKAIGAKEDDVNERLYWLVVSDEKEGLVEWDKSLDQVSWVLEDTTGRVLNLNNGKRVNSIDIVRGGDAIGDLLFFTQEGNPPRYCNIARAKGYGLDGFIEDDIAVIKKPPVLAPSASLTFSTNVNDNNLEEKVFEFAYRYKYLDEMYSAISFFTPYQFSAGNFDLDFQTFENNGMVNQFNAVDIDFNTGDSRVIGVDILARESGSNTIQILQSFDKSEQGWSDDTTETFTFSNNKIYEVLEEAELFRLYDNVPITALGHTFIGNRLCYYNYYQGYDLDIAGGIDYTVGVNSTDNTGSVILEALSDDSRTIDAIPFTITDGVMTLDLTGIVLSEGKRLIFEIDLTEEGGTIGGNYNDSFQFILNEDYADANTLAGSTEFINFVEALWTNNFSTGYVLTTPPANSSVNEVVGFEILSGGTNEIVIRTPYIKLEINNDPDPNTFEYATWSFVDTSVITISDNTSDATVKSNRDYELGMVYYDSNNRSTTALVSSTNDIHVPHKEANMINKLTAEINHLPPSWATRYKFVVKQNRFQYDNIYATIFYEDGLYRWVLLEGANKDKVNEGDVLVVKSDLDGFVSELIKVRVLEVRTQQENFLSDNKDLNDQDITEQAGLYMKIKPEGFNMNYGDATFLNYNEYVALKSSIPSINVGFFSYLDSVSGNYVDYAINGGTTIDIDIHNYESDGDEFRFTKSYVAQGNYDNFEDWFVAEANSLGDFTNYEFKRSTTLGGTDTNDPNDGLYLYVQGKLSGAAFERSKFSVKINIRLSSGVVVFETEGQLTDDVIYYETPDTFNITGGYHEGNVQTQTDLLTAQVELSFFNAFLQGQGIESYKIKDALNSNGLSVSTRPTAVNKFGYRREHKSASLQFSDAFAETTNYNGLNAFNASKINFKDLNRSFGSIQSVVFRDDNVLVMQEDKLGQVLFGRNALYKEDGSFDLVTIDNVLGSYIPYTGEYGIGKNPESVVVYGNRVYAVDAKRGTPLRLSTDGVTEMSMYGMIDHFKDLFRNNTYVEFVSGYNAYFDEYVLVVAPDSYSVGFSERDKGWTPRLSYVPEAMVSMNNSFYSFKNGELYLHNSEAVPVNNFYGVQYSSKVTVVVNDSASDDKIFKTIVQEGDEPWSVSVNTNYTQSTITTTEFNQRESRWFSYIRKNEKQTDLRGLAQGIGLIIGEAGNVLTFDSVPSPVSVGDTLVQMNGSNKETLGTIVATTGTTIEVDALANVVINGAFAFSQKDARIEGSEIRGYYMEVELENDSTNQVELFGIETNAIKSYV